MMITLNVKMIEFNNNSNEVLMQESKYHIKRTVLKYMYAVSLKSDRSIKKVSALSL